MHIADILPKVVVTITSQAPADFAVTSPLLSTIATVELLEDQITVLSGKSAGNIVATNFSDASLLSNKVSLLRDIPKSRILTVSSQTATFEPSAVVTEL